MLNSVGERMLPCGMPVLIDLVRMCDIVSNECNEPATCLVKLSTLGVLALGVILVS